MIEAKANLFTSGMNDDRRLVVGHDVPPRRKISDPIGVNGNGSFGGSQLNQAEFRQIRMLGNEFCIESDDTR